MTSHLDLPNPIVHSPREHVVDELSGDRDAESGGRRDERFGEVRGDDVEARLAALSDAELAARGLRREDIMRYVYRDMLDI